MNERVALLTSMNLYEFSQVNNYEMGILVDREKSYELYRKIDEEAMSIVRISDEIRVKVARVAKGPSKDALPDAGPVCPKCNADMVIRTANKGETFWGCSTFPKCWGMKAIEAVQPAKSPPRRGRRFRSSRNT